jgi:hypothetical protein
MRRSVLDRRMACRKRGTAALVMLVIAAASLVSCDTSVGVSPALQGSYLQNARVTNPNGGGPQVVRWGPPQNYNPGGDNN